MKVETQAARSETQRRITELEGKLKLQAGCLERLNSSLAAAKSLQEDLKGQENLLTQLADLQNFRCPNCKQKWGTPEQKLQQENVRKGLGDVRARLQKTSEDSKDEEKLKREISAQQADLNHSKSCLTQLHQQLAILEEKIRTTTTTETVSYTHLTLPTICSV